MITEVSSGFVEGVVGALKVAVNQKQHESDTGNRFKKQI
jgi:hypothetical protein